jgi:hypothetical protein
MSRLAIVAAALLPTTLPLAARATDNALSGRAVGVGLGGGPAGLTGVTGKLFLAPGVSAQAMAGHWWGRGAALGLDGLVEMPQLSARGPVTTNWYVGAGATALLSGGGGLAVCAVLGASLQVKADPVELVAEYRPTFFLGEEGRWAWDNWGAAVRYYF